MSKPRNISVDMAKGADKILNFIIQEGTDIRDADITMSIKRNIVDPTICFQTEADVNLSPDMINGKFTIRIAKEDVEDLTPRTYKYELRIVQGDTTIIPIIGDFKLYPSITG